MGVVLIWGHYLFCLVSFQDSVYQRSHCFLWCSYTSGCGAAGNCLRHQGFQRAELPDSNSKAGSNVFSTCRAMGIRTYDHMLGRQLDILCPCAIPPALSSILKFSLSQPWN